METTQLDRSTDNRSRRFSNHVLIKEFFGLKGFDHISNAAFWSILFNSIVFLLVSINTKQDALEITQADFFVDFDKYEKGGINYEVLNRKASFIDLKHLLERFLGHSRTEELLKNYELQHGVDFSKLEIADSELITYTERHIAGTLGTPSAKVVISSICNEEPIALEEMLKVLDQTQDIIQYSKALEQKKSELEITTKQLQASNEQLQELDGLKAEFISTVTHELRTPITSIKAMGKILHDNRDLPEAKQAEFLQIIVTESERIARLVTEVLDLQKVQDSAVNWVFQNVDICNIAENAFKSVEQLMNQHQYSAEFICLEQPIFVFGQGDKLTQLVINLLSNAIKFCDPKKGKVSLEVKKEVDAVLIMVSDNGSGIATKDQKRIFEKFVQIKAEGVRKPRGTGLGLFICKQIVEKHQGAIFLKSAINKGSIFTVQLPLQND